MYHKLLEKVAMVSMGLSDNYFHVAKKDTLNKKFIYFHLHVGKLIRYDIISDTKMYTKYQFLSSWVPVDESTATETVLTSSLLSDHNYGMDKMENSAVYYINHNYIF